jgi:membrane associated rhomboid family serine protease
MTLLDRLLGLFGLTRTQVRWRLRRLREDAREGKLLARAGRWVLPEGGYRYTGAIAALNVVLFAAAVMLARSPRALMGVPAPIMIRLGAWTVPHVWAGQVWRLVTSVFLHFSALHLLFNSMALLQLGPLLEEMYGRSRFAVLYLVTGVAGFAASVAWRSSGPEAFFSIGAGASGAIFGLIGAALVASGRGGGRLAGHLRGYVTQWAIYGLVMGFLLGADNVAHVGGLATGALVAWMVRADHAPGKGWIVVELLCLAATVAAFGLAARS